MRDICVLDPGQICIIKLNKIKVLNNECFKYEKNNLSLNNNISYVIKSLKKAVNQRIEKTEGKVSFALSGGLDSRILLSLISNRNKKKVVTHTLGDKNNFESTVAKKVSKELGFKHKFYEIKKNDYYDLADNAVTEGSFNSIFKNGVKTKYTKIIKKRDKSQFFMMGNALDVLIASSFSKKGIEKVKNLNSYIKWYKKTFLLFSLGELKKIFKKKIVIKNGEINRTIKNFIKKIKFDNDFINLNDALTFETRIKRWHNFSLAEQSRITNFLIPTYDKNFLYFCSRIGSNYRFKDKFRKKLIFKINPKVAGIPTSNEMTSSNRNIKLEKKYYDTNLGLDMKKNKRFIKLYENLKKRIISSNFQKIINFQYIDVLIHQHIRGLKDNTRKIFMFTTLLIILIKISNKNA